MSTFGREGHGDLFLKICREHSHVIPLESYTALDSEDQRLRSISQLQQKAQALETEMAERKQVEEALRHTQTKLESIVEQRTTALRQLSPACSVCRIRNAAALHANCTIASGSTWWV